ncbi:MAG: glycoside hydrolase family 26 protein [Streptosporangiaceae bacterium]
MDVIEFYSGFPRAFPSHEARQAAGRGALPLIQLNPRGISLASIAVGHYDAYLRTYAHAVRTFRCRVVLSFGHEMNGSWYSWGRPQTSPATFIAAWRHIYRVFKAEHVHNVIWSWDPDHVWQSSHGGSWASEWWPGAAYVDWIGIDGYQRPGQTFNSIFAKQLANIRSITRRPVYIAETGVEPGVEQPSQISALFAAVRQDHLAGLIWFDIDRKEKWRLEGDPLGLTAFHKAVAELGR